MQPYSCLRAWSEKTRDRRLHTYAIECVLVKVIEYSGWLKQEDVPVSGLT